jgi:eukaryotic-like serine/threonine-protein kinase
MKKQQHREEEIFLQALEIEVGPAREAYLDEACGGDATLREKAEKLVEAHEEPASILETFGSMGAPTGERARDQIGSYELLEELGAGGMGTVWLAQQSEPVVRKVALKIIRLGMDTKEVVSRFEAERQALAMMDHPNIAKVFDAGATETGRPYFVMELVKGIAITRYCDQEKLGTKERLDLFIKACQAIQHAHQKGIIHRDIKPSNIMVTLHDGVPVPKVIDFGIAKATEGRLTDATVYTQLHQFIGTPAYMSPEQAEMSSLDIDTRSDIYSLGVLLYELLAGSPPFDGRELMSQGLDAMRRTIREKEPVRPSLRLATLRGVELTTTAKRRAIEAPKLIHLLKGDLDWVVMKCLEKERARRYETANGLAADLKRYLNTEPVVARPPSRYYVFQKNVRRHKLAFAAVTAVTVTLCLGILVSNWQTVRAKQAERRATQSELLAKAEAVRANEQQRLAEERLTSTQQAVKEATEQRNRADRASDMAQSSLYYAEMHLGQRTWREHRGLKQMRDLLATWIPQNGSPDRRGWEWFYFNSLPYQNLRTLTVSGGNKFDQNIRDTPSTVEWNMASQRLAEGRGDGLIRIWDVDRERPTQVLKGPAPISSWCGSRWFAWSPTAQKLTAGGRDGTVVVWRTDSGRQLTVLRGHQSAVLAVAFSSDGTQVAAWGADGTIKIWEVATSQLTANITHPDGASTGAWSPNDALLATGHYDGTVTLSETHADSKVVTLGGHARTVHRLAWSPNSARLATASGDHTAKIWDVASGKMVLGPFDHSHEVTSIAWHPEGQRLATGSTDQTVKIWNTTTGFEISTLRGHLESLSSLSWGPDSRLASGSGSPSEIRKRAFCRRIPSGPRPCRGVRTAGGWLRAVTPEMFGSGIQPPIRKFRPSTPMRRVRPVKSLG